GVKWRSLEVRVGVGDRIRLRVGRGSRLFSRKSATLEECAQQPLIVPKTGSIRRLIEKHLRPYRQDLNITMELTSVVMIKRFVTSGLGVSLICASFAHDRVRTGEARLLKIEGLDLWRELALVYRKDRSLPLVASSFLKLAREELSPKTDS